MICRRCGSEFDARKYRRADGSVRCPACGTIYRKSAGPAPRQPQNAMQARPSARGGGGRAQRAPRGGSFFTRKLWKLPVWAWIVIALVILIGAGSGASRTPSTQTAAPASGNPAAAVAQATEIPAGGATEPSGAKVFPIDLSVDFGTSRIEAVSATIRSVGDRDYVICEYNWTNNSGENRMFLSEISEHVFQNGVALEAGALLDVDGNTITEVMSGYSLTVRTVNVLSDPSAEIMFSVEPLLDLTDSYAPLTFNVNPGGA